MKKIGKVCVVAAALVGWSLPLAAQEHAEPKRSDAIAAPKVHRAARAAAAAPVDVGRLRDQLMNGLTEAERAVAEAATNDAYAEMAKDPTVTLLDRPWYLEMQLRRVDQRIRLLAARTLAELDEDEARAILADAARSPSVPERVRETVAKHLLPR